MQKVRRYGILGGTFDPPHIGHLALAQEAHARLHLDRVWFLPAGTPPHKAGRTISSATDRAAMVQLAIAADERFALCTLEIERVGPSYTVQTLELLREVWGPEIWRCLILGWDMLAYLPQWREREAVVAAVDAVAAAPRPGYQPVAGADPAALTTAVSGLAKKLVVLPGPLLDVSATDLRARVASGLPVRYLVLDSVQHYIQAHDLYRPAADS